MRTLAAVLLALAYTCGGSPPEAQVPAETEASVPGEAPGGYETPPGPDTPETPEPPSAAEAVPFETIEQGSIPSGSGGQVRQVIRDEAAWREAWTALGGGRGAGSDPPAVDFTREMVILAAMETQSCVSKVTIRGIARLGDELIVDLLEAPPAPQCVCIVATRPFHVVRLARSERPVRFEVERGLTEC